MTDNSVRLLMHAERFSRIVRSVTTYAYQDVRLIRESSSYLIKNDGDETLHAVALSPRMMELQVDMIATIQGSTQAAIIPSGELRHRVLGHLSSHGVTRAGRDAFEEILLGGQDHASQGEEFLQLVEAAANALRGLGLDNQEKDFYARILRAASRGKYLPFVALPEPLHPGEFVLVEFQRTREFSVSVPQRAWGFVSGRHTISHRFAIGEHHSTHLRVKPPPGTNLRNCSPPPHWPELSHMQATTQRLWNIYLPLRLKTQLWQNKEAQNLDPSSDSWSANTRFALPFLVHLTLALVAGLMTLGPRLLLDYTADGPVLEVASLLNLYVLVGGIAVPLLLAHLQHRPVFRYLGFHLGAIAVLGIWWLLLAPINPTVWDAAIVGGALTAKEALLALWAGVERLISR